MLPGAGPSLESLTPLCLPSPPPWSSLLKGQKSCQRVKKPLTGQKGILSLAKEEKKWAGRSGGFRSPAVSSGLEKGLPS